MKVLHIINSLGTGGAEKLLVDTLPLYVANGIDVELLLLNGTRTEFLDRLQKSSVKIHHLGYSSLFNPLLIFRIIPYLDDYDLIHVHLFPALYWVSLAKVLSRAKSKLVFTKHSTSNRRMELSFISRGIERCIFRRYSKIVNISSEVDVRLKQLLKFPLDRFVLIQNGVDLTEIGDALPSNEFFFGEIKGGDAKILIQVSSFRTPKDQQTLIRAMALLPKQIKLLLVGDGPQRPECEDLARNLRVLSRIKFLRTRTDVPQLLKIADIVILSSGFEGFGLALVEGMAARKPVIGSDVPGIKGTIANAGISFPKGDSAILAERILELISDSKHYNSVAEACFERAKEFDLKLMIQKHLELYDDLMKGQATVAD